MAHNRIENESHDRRVVDPLWHHFLIAIVLTPCAVAAEDATPVFSENFSSGRSTLANWKSRDMAMWTVDQDGVLVGTNTGDRRGIGAGSPKFAQKNLRATFRFNMTDAKGVQFKLNYSGGGHIGRFIIQPGGFFFQANTNRPLAITESRNFEKLDVKIKPEQWHSFAIELYGDEITGTLDGQHSRKYRYQHLSNEIGQFELNITGTSAMFDDIVVAAFNDSEANRKRQRDDAETADLKQSNHDLLKPHQSFFTTNCNDCHGDGADEDGFQLASLGGDLNDAETLRRWVLLFDRVDKGEMPPQDYDRPDRDQQQAFLKTLHSQLTAAHSAKREVVLRRLNRAEYEHDQRSFRHRHASGRHAARRRDQTWL